MGGAAQAMFFGGGLLPEPVPTTTSTTQQHVGQAMSIIAEVLRSLLGPSAEHPTPTALVQDVIAGKGKLEHQIYAEGTMETVLARYRKAIRKISRDPTFVKEYAKMTRLLASGAATRRASFKWCPWHNRLHRIILIHAAEVAGAYKAIEQAVEGGADPESPTFSADMTAVATLRYTDICDNVSAYLTPGAGQALQQALAFRTVGLARARVTQEREEGEERQLARWSDDDVGAAPRRSPASERARGRGGGGRGGGHGRGRGNGRARGGGGGGRGATHGKQTATNAATSRAIAPIRASSPRRHLQAAVARRRAASAARRRRTRVARRRRAAHR
jgi:hypothetical protein